MPVPERMRIDRVARAGIVLFTAALLAVATAEAQVKNGFDLSNASVPEREIRGGGPPRDAIPALTDPARITAEQADGWLGDRDRVIGVRLGGEAMAYPIRILNWHEIVNDIVGDRPISVTYCPLCGSGVVFDAARNGERMTFGVSGLLYNSDVLMYDRATSSLFSQLTMRGISGPLRDVALDAVPAETTIWASWFAANPDTRVLSHALPYGRDYGTDPYAWYRRKGTTMFPVKGADRSRHAKDWAYLVLAGENKLLIADEDLGQVGGDGHVETPTGVRLFYDDEARSLRATGERGGDWTVIPGYWFALTAFHPDAIRLESSDLRPRGVR